MADHSKIEWTDASWNPIRARNPVTGKVGWHCEHATTGCENCYSEGFNKRLGTGLPFKPGHRKDIEIFLDGQMLTQPLRWKKPRKIFVCSMSDLFADFVTDEWIDKVFAVMALSPQHTFQVLTKRAERMREYVSDPAVRNRIELEAEKIRLSVGLPVSPHWCFAWPLPNVWLGVSCERQQEADERILHLLQTPAAVRFISAEPLLGPIDLTSVRHSLASDSYMTASVLQGDDGFGLNARRERIDWVIVGGESGPAARPFNIAWARSIVIECAQAGVRCFVKQLGSQPYYESFDPNCTSQDTGRRVKLIPRDRKGGDPAEWPQDLRVRQFPEVRT